MEALRRVCWIAVVMLMVQTQAVNSLHAKGRIPESAPYGHMVLGDGILWYVAAGSPYKLYAFDPESGETLHVYGGDSDGTISAVVGRWSFVDTDDGAVHAYAGDMAGRRWTYTGANDITVIGADQETLYGLEGHGERSSLFGTYWTMTWNVVALDLATGAVRWRNPDPPSQSGIVVGLDGVVGDGVVVVESRSEDYSYGLDASTGDFRWTSNPMDGYALAGGHLIVDAGHKAVYAFDMDTGMRVWTASVVSAAVDFDGGVTTVTPDTIYGVYQFPETFSLPEHYLRPSFVLALDAATGAEQWRFPKHGEAFTGVATSIVADTEHVYVENNGR